MEKEYSQVGIIEGEKPLFMGHKPKGSSRYIIQKPEENAIDQIEVKVWRIKCK